MIRVVLGDLLARMEAIIPFAQSMLEIVTRTKRLGAQNVIQMQTFVAANGSCFSLHETAKKSSELEQYFSIN